MRRVILFRHAKSDWGADAGGDHERPLNRRGRGAAEQMGRFLAATGEVPEKALCSSALRARETFELASGAGGWDCSLDLTEALYATTPPAVLGLLRRQADAVSDLLLIGHEPTWSELASRLVGGTKFDFPTAAMARIDLDVARWGDVEPGCGHLAWLVRPKLLTRVQPAD